MSFSKPVCAEQAENYFELEFTRDDYYSEHQARPGYWFGNGAGAHGLTGEVSREVFSAILHGRHPHNGSVLVPAATWNGKHIGAWDWGFGAPKSVSLLALVGGDQRLEGAHQRAVEKALAAAERYANARIKTPDGPSRVPTQNLIIALFHHEAARPTNGGPPDPQLHTHAVVANMTLRPDGQWRALDPKILFGAQRYALAVYHAELSNEVQKLGYQISVSGNRKHPWEIAGCSRELIEAFSNRTREIQERAQQTGQTSAAARAAIALYTRQAKSNSPAAELLPERLERAFAYGFDAPAHVAEAIKRGNIYNGQRGDALEALAFARNHLSERYAVIKPHDLETAALEHACGRIDLASLRAAIQLELEQGKLIEIAPSKRHQYGAFTTPQTLAAEREILELVALGQGQAPAIASGWRTRLWAAGKGLSDEQTAAIELTLTSHNRVTAIEGRAGAAKTTTVGVIRDYAHKQGYMVRGFAMTSRARDALQEAGLTARTVASLLQNPGASLAEYIDQGHAWRGRNRDGSVADYYIKPRIPPPELWIIDESSLVGTADMLAILKAAREQNPRIVFVGDAKQHTAIKAGAPLRALIDNGLTVAHLETIYRQKEAGLKKAVELSIHNAAESFDLLHSQGRVLEISDPAARYHCIADDYEKATAAGQQALVVSPANDERRELNAIIRETLVERGRVEKESREHQILIRRDLTDEQLHHARSYETGDVLHFRQGDKSNGIRDNSYLTVEAMNEAGTLLTVRAGAQSIELDPARWQGIEAFKEESRRIAVGERIQFRKPDKEHGIANGDFADIVKLNAHSAKLRFDERAWWGGHRRQWMKLAELRHIDLGYCSTSHSAQGATVDYVIVNADSARGEGLVNRRQFYTSISRARHDAKLYTDNGAALRRNITRDEEKDNALELVAPKQSASVSYDAKQSPPPPQATPPPQQQRHVSGFRFRLSAGSG
jgi:conjugative relaxase-like TrwC/TraI family protein